MVFNGMDHQQTDFVIAGLLTAGSVALIASHGFVAATCFGLATGLKCTPLLWAPYLLWRGRWKEAAWMVAVAIGLNLLPDLIRTPPEGGLWLVEWFEKFLRPMGRSDYAPGLWYAWILDNQSVAGAINRWSTTRLGWADGGITVADSASPLDVRWLRLITPVVLAALTGLACHALGRPGRLKEHGGTRSAPAREAVEHGLVATLMLLLSPMSSRPHFIILLLPCFCLARAGFVGRNRPLLAWLILAVLAALTTVPWGGQSIGRVTMWLGMLTWTTVFLFAGSALALRSGMLDAASDKAPAHTATQESSTLGMHQAAAQR
jgi:hypothetical protein